MHRLVILASVVVLAASSVNCANSGEPNANVLGPSASAGVVGTLARGGNGKPGGGNGNGGSSSLTLAMVSDGNGNGLPDWGDTVTFNVSTTATTEPNVSLTCSQDGVVVYFAARLHGDLNPNMNLVSMDWQGGAADCTAKLYYFSGAKVVDLGSISFSAGA